MHYDSAFFRSTPTVQASSTNNISPTDSIKSEYDKTIVNGELSKIEVFLGIEAPLSLECKKQLAKVMYAIHVAHTTHTLNEEMKKQFIATLSNVANADKIEKLYALCVERALNYKCSVIFNGIPLPKTARDIVTELLDDDYQCSRFMALSENSLSRHTDFAYELFLLKINIKYDRINAKCNLPNVMLVIDSAFDKTDKDNKYNLHS